jgi:hypothetical protein
MRLYYVHLSEGGRVGWRTPDVFRIYCKKVLYTYILLQYHFRTKQLVSEMPATGEGHALQPAPLFSVCSEYLSRIIVNSLHDV